MKSASIPGAILGYGLALAAAASSTAHGAPFVGFAAMGASETQGTNFSGSWVPWLAVDRGLNFGPGQTYNRAVGGSTTTSLLSRNQHTQVADLVQAGNVDMAFLFIGGLDVPPVALDILLGTLDVPIWADGVASRMMTAVDTVLAQGPQGMIVMGVPDMTLVPGAAAYTSIVSPQPIIDAIDEVNVLVLSRVIERDLIYVDNASLMRELNATSLVVGGVPINLTTGSPDPTHFFSDDIHPGRVGNGILANLMLTALNVGYGTDFDLFTDAEILARAGLSAQYTGETSNINFSQYVLGATAIPEPTSAMLVGLSITVLTASAAWRRRRNSTAAPTSY